MNSVDVAVSTIRYTAPKDERVIALPLPTGTRLGAYEVVSSLGAGGMGEVYRARDTRLQRTVAIKVLAADVRRDPARRTRFLREAQAVAALNHPHIGGLHDIGEHDGTDFLVLELIDGETLASRLAGGPLTVPEALAYGEQIAAALDHAHRHGIVHRDLKPQNVMLTKAGVKLLDFGLARLAQPIGEAIGTLPTSPATLTAEGTLLGTLPYMAPEQLEGGEADARSDIFAFGAVLYEMIACRRAFDGKSPASIIGAVLRDQPPALKDAQSLTPPALERVVRTCLEKDPDDRFHSAHDVRLALHWVSSDAPAAAPTRTTWSRWRTAQAAAVVVLSTLTGIALGLWLRPSPAESAAPTRFTVPPPDGQRILEPVLSPDGRHLVFVAGDDTGRRSLWLRAFDAETAREVPGTQGATYPFWSPDGQSIAFFAGRKLKRVAMAGGTPIDICDAENPRGGTWNQNGVIVFTPNLVSSLFRVDAAGGTPAQVTTLVAPAESSHRWAHFLPDGDRFLYLAFAAQDANRSELRVDSLTQPGAKTILKDATEGRYADGLLFFVRGDVLLAQPFDPERLALHGEPRAVLPSPAGLATGRYSFSVAASGTMAYQRAAASPAISRLTWLSRDGRHLGTIGDAGAYGFPAISPDQNRIAVGRFEGPSSDSWAAGRNSDIWIFEAPRWTGTRLTTSPQPDNAPVWSPDARRVAYAATPVFGGGTNLEALAVDGSSAPVTFHASVLSLWPRAWSRSGQFLFQMMDTRGLMSLWTVTPDTRTEPTAFRSDGFNYNHAVLSPDGRWVAYSSDLSGRNELYVDSFPTAGNRRPVPGTAGAREPRWRHDGRELYYLAADSALMAVSVTPGEAPVFGDPQRLFSLRLPSLAGRPHITHYDVARDGRFIAALVEGEATVAPMPVTVTLNGTAALRQ